MQLVSVHSESKGFGVFRYLYIEHRNLAGRVGWARALSSCPVSGGSGASGQRGSEGTSAQTARSLGREETSSNFLRLHGVWAGSHVIHLNVSPFQAEQEKSKYLVDL